MTIILQWKFCDIGWLPATHKHFPKCCCPYILVYVVAPNTTHHVGTRCNLLNLMPTTHDFVKLFYSMWSLKCWYKLANMVHQVCDLHNSLCHSVCHAMLRYVCMFPPHLLLQSVPCSGWWSSYHNWNCPSQQPLLDQPGLKEQLLW